MPIIRPFHLFRVGCVAVVLVAALNLVVARAARRLPPQQLLRRIDATAASARVLFVGDSQTEADVDPVAFSAGCEPPEESLPGINVGLGATKASEHCLILEHLLTRAPAAETLFYGFYDNLLTEPVPSRFQDLAGNRALVYAFPERAAQLIFPNDTARQWTLRAIARIPIVAERLGIWAKVERLRRSLAAIGLPGTRESRFGRASDFASIEPASPESFRISLETAVRDNQRFNFPVQQIMRIAAQYRLKCYLVAMPVPANHRSRYYSTRAWKDYCNFVSSRVQAAGGQFINASDWVPDETFEDPLHASPAGARIFSTRLAREVCPISVCSLVPQNATYPP